MYLHWLSSIIIYSHFTIYVDLHFNLHLLTLTYMYRCYTHIMSRQLGTCSWFLRHRTFLPPKLVQVRRRSAKFSWIWRFSPGHYRSRTPTMISTPLGIMGIVRGSILFNGRIFFLSDKYIYIYIIYVDHSPRLAKPAGFKESLVRGSFQQIFCKHLDRLMTRIIISRWSDLWRNISIQPWQKLVGRWPWPNKNSYIIFTSNNFCMMRYHESQ